MAGTIEGHDIAAGNFDISLFGLSLFDSNFGVSLFGISVIHCWVSGDFEFQFHFDMS